MIPSRDTNLWEETAAVAAPHAPSLDVDSKADVLVVGAGYLGLSAALHLAEAGVGGVVVLDAHGPGWGASGRNGGQVIPGLKYDPDELEAVFGRKRGERLWRSRAGRRTSSSTSSGGIGSTPGLAARLGSRQSTPRRRSNARN